MEETKGEQTESLKKSSRTKVKKYFFFDEMPDHESPKKKNKKRKNDKKILLKRALARTKSYAETNNIEKKPEKKRKLNPEELKVIKRLKRTNKPTFNPKLLRDSKDRRDILSDQLQKIEDEYGKFMGKHAEPKRNETMWDYIMKEMVNVAEFFQQRRKFRIFKAKKLALGSKISTKNRKNVEEQRIKEETFKLVKVGDTLSKMVQREFWKNIQKLNRFQLLQAQQEVHMKSQQKRLESFVNKQLKLSSKMADFLQENDEGKKSTGGADDEDEESYQSEEDETKQIVIHVKKTDYGYQYEKYSLEEKSLESQKDSLQEIANLASQFQPKGFTLNSSEVKIKQPFLIKGQLREYQLIGLNWMVMLFQKKINGILADEMGLGKTIQTISLLAHMACEKGIWGPHLIIVPTSILVNWEIEFKRWCPALKVMTYFGSPKERKIKRLGWSRINSFHVCITSYKLVMQDKKIFRRKKWYYMILDEAHNIKNFKSQRWQILLNFHSKRRLLLTGTPLQNDVGELWSLMHFLMPHIFHSHTDFHEWFLVPMQQAMQKNQSISLNIVQQLHSILRPFLLRRLKKDVEKQLPSKTEVIIRCPLSRRQKYLYDEFINKNETKNKIQGQEFLGLMNVLMQLRKVCNHPDLFEPRAIESGFLTENLTLTVPTLCILHYYNKVKQLHNYDGFNFFHSEENVGSHYIYDKQLQYLPQLDELIEMKENNDTSLEEYEGHFSYKWRKIKNDFRNRNIERAFYGNAARLYLQRPVYGHETINYIRKITSIEHKQEILKSYNMIKTLDDVIMDLRDWFNNYLVSYDRAIAAPLVYTPSKYSLQHEQVQENLEVALVKSSKVISEAFHYTHVRLQLLFPDKKFLIYDCGKLNTMMQLLIKLKAEKHKVLIFTQMTKMLDIFEFSLNVFHMTYVRLDGGTRPDVRQKLVERFNNDPKIFCFISSTRSGGIGINLTGGDVVMFYDTDWNPAMDKQAQDRCHRIGQTRNVTIYRLISEYTIEENILLKNMQKRKLDEFIMEEGNFTLDFFEKINMKDILGDMLFNEGVDTSKLSYQQFQKALENVEDKDDIVAANNATKEQEDAILEDIKGDTPSKTLDDENLQIDRAMLPPIYNYGLDFIESLQEEVVDVDGQTMDVEGNEEEEEEDEISEEEIDFRHHEDAESEDEDHENRILATKEAMKAYKDTKKHIIRNYFVNV